RHSLPAALPTCERPDAASQPVGLIGVGGVGELDGGRTAIESAISLHPQHDIACELTGVHLEIGEGAKEASRGREIIIVTESCVGSQEHDGGSGDVVGVVGALCPVAGGLVELATADRVKAAPLEVIGVGPRGKAARALAQAMGAVP